MLFNQISNLSNIIFKIIEQMNKSIALISALATLTDSAEAKWSWGSCPDVLNMPNFEPARYSGKWYEIVRDR